VGTGHHDLELVHLRWLSCTIPTSEDGSGQR